MPRILHSLFARIRVTCAYLLVLSGFLWVVYQYSPAGPLIKSAVSQSVDIVASVSDQVGLPNINVERPELPALPSLPQPSTPTAPAEARAALAPAGSFATDTPRTLGSDLIRSLDVFDPHEDGSYNREKQFGPAWKDVDGNGCDTRNDILHRDLANVTMKDGSKCVVASGVLADPYSGTTIAWKRAQVNVRAVGDYIDVDHIVPLKVVWYSGGSSLTQAQREAIANDPDNLAVVDAYTNQHFKGDKSISEWAPSAQPGRCQYAVRYAKIIAKYGLTVSRDDATALQGFANECR